MSARKTYSREFKVRVVLEAFKGQRTINELSSQYGIHPNQVKQWKKQAVESLPEVFSTRRVRVAQEEEALKGLRGHLSKAPVIASGSGTPDLSLLVTRGENRTGQSSVEYGHHVYSVARRVCVSGGSDRWVFALCAELGSFDHVGDGVLCQYVGAGAGVGTTGESSIRIKDRNSRVRRLQECSRRTRLRSVWMGADGPWITSLSNGSGAA